jgi:CheY-like chemotaxis protein
VRKISLEPLVLCVDDDPSYVRLRKAVLEKKGFNVITATNAADAVAAFRAAPVCCTIADHLREAKPVLNLQNN